MNVQYLIFLLVILSVSSRLGCCNCLKLQSSWDFYQDHIRWVCSIPYDPTQFSLLENYKCTLWTFPLQSLRPSNSPVDEYPVEFKPVFYGRMRMMFFSSSINVFKKELLKFIRPGPNLTFDIHDTKGLKLLTRLRLGLSHLGDHKFRRNFQDSVCPMCTCGQDIETTTHFFFHCPNHRCQRKSSFNPKRGNISGQSYSTI